MLILGITNNDSSGACLVEDDQIVAAVHEERFSRIKGDNAWPEQSIAFLLTSSGKTLQDLDVVAYGWNAGFNQDNCLNLYVERVIFECINNFDNVCHLKKRVADEVINDKAKRAEFDRFIAANQLQSKVQYIDHHDTHAWGAWLCSPYQQALVVTCDGRGDFISFTVRYIDDGNETVLQRETTIDSLGFFYGRITHLLGFTANKHEGKITGLAAHGNPQRALPLMRKMIDVQDSRIVANCGDYFLPSYHGYSEKLISEINAFSAQDIAAAAQKHIQDIIAQVLMPYIKNYRVKNICLAGGTFANVRLNQCIRELPGIASVFVLPCMGDEGLPLAAAVTALWRKTRQRCQFGGMALGPAFSDQQIAAILAQQNDFQVETPPDLHRQILQLLGTDCILAFFRGRMEFGPRALCQRSIIYHANNKDINIWLNKKLQRTEFMPFAPVTAENLAEFCFTNWRAEDKSAEFMTITYHCKSMMATRCPATVHIDNTARPQVIKQQHDPFMYTLINQWYQLSGQPCLVNTSFNRHEEPIINTPQQALTVLGEGVIDALVFNDKFIVTRKS